jgi:hypothetical protein
VKKAGTTRFAALADLGVQVYNFTGEQASALEAIKSLRVLAGLPAHSPFKVPADEMQKELILLLARQIGSSIVTKEIN